MKNLQDYNFELPPALIAQTPTPGGRDQSRLLVLDRASGALQHKRFFDIIDFLQSGDVLVMNNSKVIPARLYGRKRDTGGAIELLLVREQTDTTKAATESVTWEAMIRWKHPVAGAAFEILGTKGEVVCSGELIQPLPGSTWLVRFAVDAATLRSILHEAGRTPIPPYISGDGFSEEVLREQYQTVFAAAHAEGSVAAPTAGLHFTPELLTTIQKKGVELAEVTLHVGLGTFLPMKTDDLSKHVMHAEQASISEDVAAQINRAKEEGRRVIAVGTTTVRTLESFAVPQEVTDDTPADSHTAKNERSTARVEPGTKDTQIFITPGYEFQIVDAMITNFHLPKSTLLLLVSAFAGREHILSAYHTAIQEQYRFFSFGDAMFIQ